MQGNKENMSKPRIHVYLTKALRDGGRLGWLKSHVVN